MTLLKHTGLGRHLAGGDPPPQCILVGGDTFLVRGALDALKAHLLPPEKGQLGLESLDGKTTPMGDIIEQAATFSFLMSEKVIVVRDAPLFAAQATQGEISYSAADLDRLTGLLEEGLPEGHFLVFTTPSLDRRKKIFKALDKAGLIIDCTVAQGVRKADLDEQRAVLEGIAANVLRISGKRIDTQAFSLLLDLTGFNPDLFAKNLEKLESYSGNAAAITVDHVRAVVRRDKKDPIFSLTNALMDRNPGQSLFYLSSLFRSGFHPLQILKSFENQVRKLVLVKSFAQELAARRPDLKPGRMNFNVFKQQMMPVILARDEQAASEILACDALMAGASGDESGEKKKKGAKKKGAKKKGAKKKPAPPADMMLAPNPKSPYPVFQTFQKAVKFSLDELRCALIALGDLDYALKTSAVEADVGIENFVITFCRKGGFVPWSEKQK